jgi:hypothetical protein
MDHFVKWIRTLYEEFEIVGKDDEARAVVQAREIIAFAENKHSQTVIAHGTLNSVCDMRSLKMRQRFEYFILSEADLAIGTREIICHYRKNKRLPALSAHIAR